MTPSPYRTGFSAALLGIADTDSAGLTHRTTLLYTVVVTEPLDLGEAGESRVHLRGALPGA